jgi:hypothetical protein
MSNDNEGNESNEFYKNVQKMVKRSKKIPQDLSNDELALHIEFWMSLEGSLTDAQKSFFEEVVWRLRLMVEKEQENNNE